MGIVDDSWVESCRAKKSKRIGGKEKEKTKKNLPAAVASRELCCEHSSMLKKHSRRSLESWKSSIGYIVIFVSIFC